MSDEKRLIYVDDFIKEHCADCKYFGVDGICTDKDFVCGSVMLITELPTVDAVEVAHGSWEYQPPTITLNASWKCTACNKNFWEHILETRYFSYCPNCGAKMDL